MADTPNTGTALSSILEATSDAFNSFSMGDSLGTMLNPDVYDKRSSMQVFANSLHGMLQASNRKKANANRGNKNPDQGGQNTADDKKAVAQKKADENNFLSHMP